MEQDSGKTEHLVGGVYALETELGRGGMGTVYLAEHRPLRRKTALKVPLPQMREQPETRERFEREARLMSRLHHENIAAVYDLRWGGKESFIAMEYVEGLPLFDYIAGLPISASLRRVVGLFHQIARALDYAHEMKVVHRDLKPGNVLVERKSGRVKILDFGLARGTSASHTEFRTAIGMVVGTPGFMAPEQMMEKEASPASDIYSFGVLLYRMLTNAMPWEGVGQQLVMAQLMKPPAPIHRTNPELPEALGDLFAQCLSVKPEDRPPSAGSFLIVVVQTLGYELLTRRYRKVVMGEAAAGAGGESAEEVTRPFTGDLAVDSALEEFFSQERRAPAG